MKQTSRELVCRCLDFETPERIPVDIWSLPWAKEHLPECLEEVNSRFPGDIGGVNANIYNPSSIEKGNPYQQGAYIDEWGCVFKNIHSGVIGEVRTPLLPDISDWDQITPPYETLPTDLKKARDAVNRSCAKSDKFIKSECCPRPWERFQFIRGTENAMMDIMMPEEGAGELLKKIHDFYMKELEFRVSTDVDAIFFMDDWGSQNSLLIPPPLWRELFKPLYKDYCDIARANDKYILMHSDGYISEIYPDLVELGVNALNSQIFCMDMDELAKTAKGKMTFWGEIDRQHILCSSDPEDGRKAVRQVAEKLYDPAGGVIAQFEIGPGAKHETVIAILEEWRKIK